jgi:hypothetical protein
MAQPGLAGSQFPSEDAMIRRIKDLERDVQQLRSANQLATAGIRAIDGGIVVDGSMDVQGAETVSGTLAVTGNADFTGNVHIGGTLDLPAGIINNDALQAPVYPAVYHADTQNISITSGSNVEKVGVDVAVPAGYTQALVSLTITMNMTNNSASTDLAYVGANINGTSPGWASVASATVGQAISLNNTVVALVTGLTGGGTFRLTGKASSGTNTWPAAGSSNVMNLNATVQFLR